MVQNVLTKAHHHELLTSPTLYHRTGDIWVGCVCLTALLRGNAPYYYSCVCVHVCVCVSLCVCACKWNKCMWGLGSCLCVCCCWQSTAREQAKGQALHVTGKDEPAVGRQSPPSPKKLSFFFPVLSDLVLIHWFVLAFFFFQFCLSFHPFARFFFILSIHLFFPFLCFLFFICPSILPSFFLYPPSLLSVYFL